MTPHRTYSIAALCLATVCFFVAPFAHAQWTSPTPEELSMTSQREVPGARSVILFQEETSDDTLHMFSIYTRIKVLTELGKQDANVELGYVKGQFNSGFTVNDISGRTIHADGTIIPFTGKPFEKLIEKSSEFKYMAKVFTLPSVEIGSILEYRYKLRYDDSFVRPPDWYLQGDLFVRRAHYQWKPTMNEVTNGHDEISSTVAWSPSLPPGAEIKESRGPNGQSTLDLNVTNIPPVPDEEYMPPIYSSTYRVNFYYTAYRTAPEFWKNEGKYWSKQVDKFIGPNRGVSDFVGTAVAPADTQDQKLRKLYAAIMAMDNTDYTRQHSQSEEKSQGLGAIKSTDDILARKRGSSDQLAQLLVAMARAAGIKAYVMGVVNRDRHLFNQGYLSLSQIQDYIAVANIDGKDIFLDPGDRYTPYGHLAWRHTYAQGLRQIDGGQTAIVSAPSEPLMYNHVSRVANLALDEHGKVTGTVKFVYNGEPALRWRHKTLSGDVTSLNKDLEKSLAELLPGGMEIKVDSIRDLDEYEKPLTVLFNISGAVGSTTSTRLLVPSDIFEVNTKPAFTHEKRDLNVYFQYSEVMQDAIRIALPPNLTVETLPQSDKYSIPGSMTYAAQYDYAANAITIRRDYARGLIMFPPSQYSTLRTFYTKFETKDQEPIILKSAPVSAPKGD